MLKRLSLWLLSAAISSAACAAPVTLDFESLPDLRSVTTEYAALGLTVQGGFSLTAGFSLNEVDFPPHSGQKVLGNETNSNPLALMFATPTDALSAWFTHGAALSITSYAADGSLLGTVVSASNSNFRRSELIDFGYANASQVLISSTDYYVLDDLSFDSHAAPEPAGTALVALALAAAALARRHANGRARS